MSLKKAIKWTVLLLLLLLALDIVHKYLGVTLRADGRIYRDYTFEQKTVAEWLNQFKIKTKPLDIVEPPLTDQLRRGQTIYVTRVRQETINEEKVVDFTLNWKRRLASNLRLIELQNGYRQTTRRQLQCLYHDGKLVAQVQIKKEVHKEPVERIALLSRHGFPEKIYDLSKISPVRMKATAYWLGDPQVPGSVTFSGHQVRRGLVAVDPRVLPLRQRLYIPGYGYAYSSDTGSAIKGKRIDLFVNNNKDNFARGFNDVTVYVLEKSGKW